MRTAKNNPEDKRCALCSDETCDDEWCHGCSFYVCTVCDTAMPLGTHDVIEHIEEECDE